MKKYLILLIVTILLMMSCSVFIKKERAEKPGKITLKEELEAENQVADGIDFYQEGKYSEAIKRWNKAIKVIPNDAEVHNFLGLAYHRIGKLDSAIVSFELAVENDQKYHQAWNNLGYMHFLKSEYEPALQFFDRALRENPNYEQARLNRKKTAQILQGKIKIQAFELVEKTSEADSLEYQIKNYRNALGIDSNYVDAWNNLGVAYYYYGNLDSAVICLRKALDINPNYPPAHNNVGYLLDGLGEYDKAIIHYQKAIKLRPLYLVAMANLVDTYVNVKEYASARQILNAMRQISPENYLVRERITDFEDLLYNINPNDEEGK